MALIRGNKNGDAPDHVNVNDSVPFGVRLAAAWSWRTVAIILVAAAAIWLIIQLSIIVIPVLVAVLLAGLLIPLRNFLERHKVPHGLAVVIAFLGLLVAVAALIFLVITQLRNGFSGIGDRLSDSYDDLLVWLKNSPLGLNQDEIQGYVDQAVKSFQTDSSGLVAGALSGAATAGHVLVGAVLTLFTTLFFLLDGKRIWKWVVRLFPHNARAAVDGAGQAAWISVGEYVRVQVVVALIDAVGILIVALILQVPFAIPIAILVFLTAFIPFVGALASGALAVLVALLYLDPVIALIMLGGVILVNQLESHILQPLLMGNAVKVHPLGVVLAVSIGSLVGGIAGAVFAVPIAAALNSMIKYIAGGGWKNLPEPDTELYPPDERKPRRSRKPRPEDVKTVA
jgi:predicted PurR-regulated permease PerM